jgi:hypothetical protein
MPEIHLKAFAAGVAVLCLVVLLTFPSSIGIASHFRDPKPKTHVYEDKDGVATEKTMAEYTVVLPKFLLAIFTTLGLLTAIALGVLATVNTEEDPFFFENWINVSVWVSLIKRIGMT